MATTTTQSASSTLQPTIPMRSRVGTALTAFLAILRRDIVVTGREFISFLLQVLLQPLFFLFIFGKILPSIGFTGRGFTAILLPGIVALTVVTTALQGVTLPLVLDLGFAREIDDRLLAPLPVELVAVEKVLFAAIRGLIAGAIIFPLAYWILGSGYQVRTDAIGALIGIMVLTAFAGATLGLTIGTLVKPEQIGLMFALIFTPLIFTGSTYYPWASLGNIKWFQIITLFNPLTYASEGLRSAMVPGFNGQAIPTLAMGWVLLGLGVTFVVFLYLGIRTFHRRVVM
jgi:ABC-2 type transport system permease protein